MLVAVKQRTTFRNVTTKRRTTADMNCSESPPVGPEAPARDSLDCLLSPFERMDQWEKVTTVTTVTNKKL